MLEEKQVWRAYRKTRFYTFAVSPPPEPVVIGMHQTNFYVMRLLHSVVVVIKVKPIPIRWGGAVPVIVYWRAAFRPNQLWHSTFFFVTVKTKKANLSVRVFLGAVHWEGRV